MSDMKCPFCGEKLQQTFSFNPTQFWCSNYYDHKHPINLQGTKELWQALTDSMKEHDLCHDALVERTKELDRTRKALDVAVDALKLFDSGQYTPQPDAYGLKTDASRLARKAIEQITALEQKE